MHSVRCTSTSLARLKAHIQPARGDGLILDAVLQHLLFRGGAVHEVQHARVPGLDHGERVLGHHGALFEERDRLVPGGVGLVLEMRYMVLR